MLTLLVLAAEAEELSPRTLVILGAVFVLVAACFCVAIVNDRVRAIVRWGTKAAAGQRCRYLVQLRAPSMLFCSRLCSFQTRYSGRRFSASRFGFFWSLFLLQHLSRLEIMLAATNASNHALQPTTGRSDV
jgi:hypothetical protein